MAKKWLLRLLALTMALVMLMCLCAWCIDPYMLYRVRDNQYLLNSRLVTPGLIKNYDYDTVLIGSSMIQNTDMGLFREILGGKPLKITTGAISLTEIQKLTDKIGELGKAEHYYICLDQYLFAPEKWDDMDRFPDYLMDDNPWNDYRYLLGYETWMRFIPIDIALSGAKALAWAANKPIYGINHVIGHIAVTQLQFGPFPKDTLALIVSGGHTSLLHVEDVARHIDVVGTTLDDAAGECFDKVARLLGFPYPGGPHIDRHAQLGNPHAIKVPQGLTQGKAGQQHPYDFSFSGVKTAVARWIEQQQAEGNEIPIDDVCASLADSVATVLAKKAMRGCEQYGSKTLIVGGGFSANSQLRAKLLEVGAKHGVEVRIPQIKLCTDNGAMVAMLGVNLVESGVKPSEPDFAIDSAMPLTKISM